MIRRGLFSWLLGTDEARVARARALLASGRPDLARARLLGLDEPAARQLLVDAESALALLNLEVVVAACDSGDEHRAQKHLECAEGFDHGRHPEAFREARRALRDLRAGSNDGARREEADRATRALAVDPFGFGGRSFLEVGARQLPAEPDDGEVARHLSHVLRGYPEALRASAANLGAPFARAVLDTDEGRADQAFVALDALPNREAVVCWELARASHALGDLTGAAQLVRNFAKLAGGHAWMGAVHSGVLLAELTARSGDRAGALRTLRDVRVAEPEAGAALYAELLEPMQSS